MDNSKLLLKKQNGDLNMVAQILTKNGKYVTPANAWQLLHRESAKRHQEAIEALRRVVESREVLIEQ